MKRNRIAERAEYYTSHMPIWKCDKQDISQYVIMNFEFPRNDIAYMTLQTKLTKLGLMNVCKTIISYITDEQMRFDRYRNELPEETPPEFIYSPITST